MKGKKRTMTRRRRLTRATRRRRNSQRRNLMVKFTSIKNGTQVMRVPSQKGMTW
jgi:hypothetical protein